MLTGLSDTQLNLIASNYKEVTWYFEVTTTGSTIYRWSTKDIAAESVEGALMDPDSGTISFYSRGANQYRLWDWTYKISKFSGITMRKSSAENRIISPSDLVFNVTNESNTLTASDFTNAKVKIVLQLSDGSYTDVIRTWRFQVKRVEDYYQELIFTCEDFLQQKINGYYPNTPKVDGLFPNSNVPKEGTKTRNDNYVVPVPFGTPYIPLRSIYVQAEAKRFYLLGPSTPTYAIGRMKSPREFGKDSVWLSNDQHGPGEFDFNQQNVSDGVNTWKAFLAIIADDNNDGIANVNGIWQNGDYMYDAPVRFYRSDTVSMTNPADVIRYVLKDMGIDSTDIDDATFATAKATFTSWGLTFNGAFYFQQAREEILSSLLCQCHAYLVVGECIELHVLSKTSQKTITKANVVMDSFSYTMSDEEESDSGYVAFNETLEPQDVLKKYQVPAKAGISSPANETLEIEYVQDSDNALILGSLYFQRRLLPNGNVSFQGQGSLLAIQPDDIITINDTDYGGSYDVLVNSVSIKKDCSIAFDCVRFSDALDDFTDVTPTSITIYTDSTNTNYQVVISGLDGPPSSGENPNALRNRLLVGDKIILDSGTDGNVLIKDGSDNIILRMGTDSVQGFFIYDTSGNTLALMDSTELIIGEVAADSPNMIFDQTDGLRIRSNTDDVVKFDVSGDAFILGSLEMGTEGQIYSTDKDSYADTTAGFFLGYDAVGTTGYKFNIGDADSYLKWSGTALDIKMASGENITISGGAGIIVEDSGNITVQKGGDIIFENDGSSPSEIIFKNSLSNTVATIEGASSTALVIQPGLSSTYTLKIGTNSKKWDAAQIYADYVTLWGGGSNADNNSEITLYNSQIIIKVDDSVYDPQIKIDGTDGQIEYTSITGITVEDEDWFGLGSAAGRLIWNDDTEDVAYFADCDVGIATGAPFTRLHIRSGTDGAASSASGSLVTLQGGSAAYIQFLGTTASVQGLIFGDTTNNQGAFVYDHTLDGHKWKVAGNYEMTLTASVLRAKAVSARLNLGDATDYWNDISYKTLTDRGCLGWFDDGVEMQDGSIVSDIEALKMIKKHGKKNTVYGVPMLDYASMPKAVYKKADKEGEELPRDEDDQPYHVDHDGNKVEAQDGAEMTALFSIMLGAIKEIDKRLEKLENGK